MWGLIPAATGFPFAAADHVHFQSNVKSWTKCCLQPTSISRVPSQELSSPLCVTCHSHPLAMAGPLPPSCRPLTALLHLAEPRVHQAPGLPVAEAAVPSEERDLRELHSTANVGQCQRAWIAMEGQHQSLCWRQLPSQATQLVRI